jgi:hypothetical protein
MNATTTTSTKETHMLDSTRQLITGALGGQAGFSPITPAEQDAYAEQVAVLNATPGNSRVTS